MGENDLPIQKIDRRVGRRQALVFGAGVAAALAGGGFGKFLFRDPGAPKPIEPAPTPERVPTDLEDAVGLAVADFKKVVGIDLDYNQVLHDTVLMPRVSLDRRENGRLIVQTSLTTHQIPSKIHISSDFIALLPNQEKKPMLRALVGRELVHYDAVQYEDPELSTLLFSNLSDTKDLPLESGYIQGFRLVGKDKNTGVEMQIFSDLENAAALTIGNYIVIEQGIFPAGHVFFEMQQEYRKNIEAFSFLVKKLFLTFDEGIKEIAAMRREPGGLATFAERIGERLGDNSDPRKTGLAVLSHVNTGDVGSLREAFVQVF